jgi:hypothetical protein
MRNGKQQRQGQAVEKTMGMRIAQLSQPLEIKKMHQNKNRANNSP